MVPPVAPAPKDSPPAHLPVSETARGGRIWRVAAAVASGFFHATEGGGRGGGGAAAAVPAGVSSSASSSSSHSTAAAAAAFFAADAADFPEFVDEVRERERENGKKERERRDLFFFFPLARKLLFLFSSFLTSLPFSKKRQNRKTQLVDLICRFTPHDDRPALLRLLRLLDTRFGTLLVAGRGGGGMTGGRSVSPQKDKDKNEKKQKQKQRRLLLLPPSFLPPRRFPDFSPEEREAVLLRWMRSRGPLGQAARGLKSLVFLALFRFVEVEEGEKRGEKGKEEAAASSPSSSSSVSPLSRRKKNPFWDACSYSSPSCSASPLLPPPPSPPRNGTSSAASASLPAAPPAIVVSPAKVATEATLLARTVDASKIRSAAEASARFSALGFAPVSSPANAAGKKRVVKNKRVGVFEDEGENVVALSADAVVVGCTILTLLTMSIAVARSSRFRMYAHVNDTLAPASSTGNR